MRRLFLFLHPAALGAGLLLVCAVLAGAAPAGVEQPNEKFEPVSSGSLNLPGQRFSGSLPLFPVSGTIEYDDYGIPTCTAPDLASLFFLDAYSNARDRFFQIDFFRKAGAGRLAELYGVMALPMDIFIRDLAFDRAADSLIAGADDRVLRNYEAAVNGVNWYIGQMTLGYEPVPPEYLHLGIEPEEIEPWTLHDTALLATLFLFGLSDPFFEEMMFGLPYYFFPEEYYHDLVRFAPIDSTVIVPGFHETAAGKKKASCWKSPGDMDREEAGRLLLALSGKWNRLRSLPGLPRGDGAASNNWAVSGALTESGFPILCSDPHLETLNPSFMYLKKLRSPGHSLTGGAFSGVPGIFIGHSERCAIGATALSPDLIDLYYEIIPDKDHVLFDGRLVPLEKTAQEYRARVMGVEMDVTWMVLDPFSYFVPHHGPIIVRGLLGRTGLSMKWNGYEKSTDMNFFFKLIGSRSFEEAKDSFELRHTAGLNQGYADIDGNLYYSCRTALPSRPWAGSWPPFLVLPGQGGFEWDGVADPALLPHVENPEAGYFVSANNDPYGGSLDNDPFNDPVYIGASFRPGFRASRISRLIEEKSERSPLTVDDMFDIQADIHSYVADRFLPFLFEAAGGRELSPAAAEALDRLEQWDRRAAVAGPGASIFQTLLHRAVNLTFPDDLGLLNWSILDDELAMKGLYFLLAHPEESATGDALFDIAGTPGVESPEDILVLALEETVTRLEERFGTADQDAWPWGELHRTIFPHPLGGDFTLPRPGGAWEGGYPGDGTMYSVDVAMVGVKDDDFSFAHVPVMRIVVDLDPDHIRSWAVIQGGQDGRLGSDHYNDQTPLWLSNHYIPMQE